MKWMAENVELRHDPGLFLPGCRTIIMIAVNYYTPELHLQFPNFPRISRYAWGRDYHKVVGNILREISRHIDGIAESAGITGYTNKITVDSGPFRDKVWAWRAGLGWIGKNSILITRKFGSWVFLGALLTTLELEPDGNGPHPDHCGKCTRCLDACPTGALIGPRRFDARACISYLTVEHAGEIPSRYRDKLSGWLFGCDECQEVCPWNIKFAKQTGNRDFYPRTGLHVPDLNLLSQMDDEEFGELTAGTPLRRAGRERLRRNTLAVMGLL